MVSRGPGGRGGALVAFAIALVTSAAPAANPPLAARGPISPVHPLPLWYQDSNGIKLEPCLDATAQTGFPNGYCGLTSGAGLALVTTLNPTGSLDLTRPISYPDNFPATVNYGMVNLEVPVGGNTHGFIYTTQVMGTFAGSVPQVVTQ